MRSEKYLKKIRNRFREQVSRGMNVELRIEAENKKNEIEQLKREQSELEENYCFIKPLHDWLSS
jgi:hypothetical protein